MKMLKSIIGSLYCVLGWCFVILSSSFHMLLYYLGQNYSVTRLLSFPFNKCVRVQASGHWKRLYLGQNSSNAAHRGPMQRFTLWCFISHLFQHYFLVIFGHDGQKPLELRTEEDSDCNEWVEAIQQARYNTKTKHSWVFWEQNVSSHVTAFFCRKWKSLHWFF